MQAEAPDVRVEGVERGGAADVRDPGPERRRGSDLRDGAVGDAQQDELRRSPRRARRLAARAARSPSSRRARARRRSEHSRSSSPCSSSRFGIPGSGSVPSARYFSASRAWRCARTAGQSSSVTLYHALSRFSPSRTSMWCRWIPSNVAPSASSARARALVLRVRLPLDAPAAPGVEGMLAAGGTSPRRSRRCPTRRGGATSSRSRPSGAPAGGRETASSRRTSSCTDRDERDLRSCVCRCERLRDERVPRLTRLRLHDAEPAPRPRIARREPESLLVLGAKRLEADDASLEGRCRPRSPPHATVHSARADLRVRVHGVRVALRRARPLERSGRDLPRVRRREGPEAALELRRPRRSLEAGVQRPLGRRRRLLRRLVRLRPSCERLSPLAQRIRATP